MDIILHFQSKKAALFKKSAVQSKFNHLKRDPRAHKEKKRAPTRLPSRERTRFFSDAPRSTAFAFDACVYLSDGEGRIDFGFFFFDGLVVAKEKKKKMKMIFL